MITIPEVVREIVDRSPFLSEALYENIGNISSIARKIKPEIEKRLMEDVSEEAVAMALRRIKRKLKPSASVLAVLKDSSNITVRSNVTEFMFLNSSDTLKIHQEALRKTESRKDAFFNISMGFAESIIVISEECEKDIEKILENQKGAKKVKDLTSITIKISDKMTMTAPLGVYYSVLKALAWGGVNVIEVASIGWEFNVLVSNKEANQAFSILKSLTS